jgi:UDP-N-acetylglucosamine--N-acetylmuramyl-(pentapeptide) pyrophosphoryl-undecaprenol N-acetylglucosamine transferase
LIPYPFAADNHQRSNALAFAQSGAALLLPQETATPDLLAKAVLPLLQDASKNSAMRQALSAWQTPGASAQIAERILRWNLEQAPARHPAAAKQWPVLTC